MKTNVSPVLKVTLFSISTLIFAACNQQGINGQKKRGVSSIERSEQGSPRGSIDSDSNGKQVAPINVTGNDIPDPDFPLNGQCLTVRDAMARFSAQDFLNQKALYPAQTRDVVNSGRINQIDDHINLGGFALPDSFTITSENGNSREQSVQRFMQETSTASMLLIKDGKVVYEYYNSAAGYERKSKTIVWSVSKTITALLVGIAVDKGWIESIEDKVTKYVPTFIGSGYESVSVRDLLEMKSGIQYSEEYTDLNAEIQRLSNSAHYCSSAERTLATFVTNVQPGTEFKYNSADTQALGSVLARAIRANSSYKSVSDFMSAEFWGPLGAESDAFWLTDGTGLGGYKMELTYAGFNLTTRDMARIGLLMLHGGVSLDKKPVVPSQWIKDLQSESSSFGEGQGGYGYQTWLGPDSFSALGVGNQFIGVFPAKNMIYIRTGFRSDYYQNPRTADQFQFMEAIVQHGFEQWN